MRNGLSALTGDGGNARDEDEATRRSGMQLGAEAVRVGHALGYTLGKILNMQADELVRAADGDKAALAEVVGLMRANASVRSDAQRPSMLQDVVKGRRTETDDINGFVCVKGERRVMVPGADECQRFTSSSNGSSGANSSRASTTSNNWKTRLLHSPNLIPETRSSDITQTPQPPASRFMQAASVMPRDPGDSARAGKGGAVRV